MAMQMGCMARVCFAWPPEPSYQRLCNDVAEDEPELINALTRLADLPAGDDEEFAPRRVSLSADAVELFEQFRQFLHTGKESLDGREREWWAKGGTHVLRLAGTLAYLDWSWSGGTEPADIAAEYVAAAIRLWREYFWPHSRAALRQVGLSDRHHNARRVLRWIRAREAIEVSVKDIRRDALAHALDAAQTETLLGSLVTAGWLRRQPQPDGPPQRGKPVLRWSVNPALQGPQQI
jgi:Protein of unknown function (DUF3987)